MRRLFALTIAVAAAFAAPASADDPDNSPVPCYYAGAGDYEAGVCAGVWCPDLCLIVVDPYCHLGKLECA